MNLPSDSSTAIMGTLIEKILICYIISQFNTSA